MRALFRKHAVNELEGVGDPTRGEWIEETAKAVHIRRRLSESEDAIVGPVLDVRGTEEARRRLHSVAALWWKLQPEIYRAEAFGESR